jgi:hypothetical protein
MLSHPMTKPGLPTLGEVGSASCTIRTAGAHICQGRSREPKAVSVVPTETITASPATAST